MKFKTRILIAPLNWGLGHATRCIPIINALINCGFEPIIASDGASLKLLEKEFPAIKCLELPSYYIMYSKYGLLLKWELFKILPKLFFSIKKEKKLIQRIIKNYHIKGVISDNRFGVYSVNRNIPSVYLTHQLQVLSGMTTWLTTKIHQQIIKKYHECWVPDFDNKPNLSGTLGHLKTRKVNLKFIGPLSRFNKTMSNSKYDIMLLLSGPEPQRTLLEQKVLCELKDYKGTVVVIQGNVENIQKVTHQNKVTTFNFMTTVELEHTIKSSDLIISRSGYTSIMDFASLEKKVFFIPTPGQYEQLYLAKNLQKSKIAPFCKQKDFTIKKLKHMNLYNGFKHLENEVNYKTLFSLFKGE